MIGVVHQGKSATLELEVGFTTPAAPSPLLKARAIWWKEAAMLPAPIMVALLLRSTCASWRVLARMTACFCWEEETALII